MANKLLQEGIYVIGFFFPVVPKGKARIRVQLSAAHSKEHLDKAIASFIKIGKEIKMKVNKKKNKTSKVDLVEERRAEDK